MGASPRAAAPDGVPPDFVRSARFWLRAYPRRWRAARSDEVLGVLADLAPPGARRLEARTALDLVRGGWGTRVREHPPLGPWLLYRLVDRRLPAHLHWVRDDIDGPLYPARTGGAVVVLTLLLMMAFDSFSLAPNASDLTSVAILVTVWTAAAALLGAQMRRQARERQLLPRPGEPVRPGSMVRVPALRRRVAARAGLPWLAGALSVLLGVCVAAAALAPTTVWVGRMPPEEGLGFGVYHGGEVPRGPVLAVLGLSVVAGAVLGVAAARRLRRVRPPVQPARQLVTMGARRATAVVLGLAVLSALPVAEALGEVSLAMSLPLGMAAGVLAPPAVVAWAVARRSPEGAALALVDARRVALSGRAPQVDEPALGLAPADASLIGLVQQWPYSAQGPTAALG